MTFRAAMKALEDDAATWTTVGVTLSEAGTTANGLVLGGHELSKIGMEEGLVDTYQQIQHLVARLSGEGARESENIAATLRMVKAQYELDDDQARRTLQGVWDAPR